MINYNWDCKTVEALVSQDDNAEVVHTVHWRVTGVSEELNSDENPYTVTSIGTQALETSEIVNFIPFAEVTHEGVVAWTKAAMGEEEVADLEANIATQLAALVTPTSITLTIADSAE